MMLLKRLAALLLVAFFCVGVLAYSAPMMQMGMQHDVGSATHQICPMMGNTTACANVLEHISHWQTAFVGVVVEILTLLALAFVFARSFELFSLRRFTGPPRILRSISDAPTLFQELFSQGILNPKTL